MKTVRVTGCGISAIGFWNESMIWIYNRIVERGGIPEVVEVLL
jgi:hypothetical protein